MDGRRTSFATAIGLLLAGPAAAAPALEAVGGSAALVGSGRTARLEMADGSRLPLELPPGAVASSLHPLDGGWLVAGSHRVGGAPPRAFFLVQGAGGARRLPAPAPGDPGDRQIHPLPFVDHGRLAGAVWLEGGDETRLGVRAAAWNGRRFGAPVWVRPPSSGSQLALTGAVLDDGSWLLAWAAFDGADDEVLWSRRVGSAWQPPARVDRDDSWPDITPALTAVPGGALLAWSGYDGSSYRAVVARFANQTWHRPRTVGAAGSLYPAFRGGAAPPHLVYLDAAGGAWEVVEIDADGTARRRATAPAMAGDETPLVESGPDEVVLRWPGARRPARAAWREAR